jgi:hypothetical protein
VAILFGLGIPISAVMLLASYKLRLDDDGFEIAHYFQRTRTAWRDTADFKLVVTPDEAEYVCYNDANSTGDLSELEEGEALAGFNAALAAIYGLTPEEMVNLLSAWRARALSRG